MKRRERQEALALITAVQFGDIEAARALLDSGLNPNLVVSHPNFGKTTALDAALESKKPLLAHLLVDRGADVCLQAHPDDKSVATKAVYLTWRRLESDEAEESAQSLVPKLLAKGARPSADCLVSAAIYGDLKMLQVLLGLGLGNEPYKPTEADPERRARDAALAGAVGNRQENTVAELLRAGANPDVRVGEINPIINVAVGHGHVPITKALIAAKANLNQHATVPIGSWREERVTQGERRGTLLVHAPASAREATPLIIAIRLENLELVQLLVEADADLDATDGDGFSPLAWAVRSKFKAAEDCLRSHGALEEGMDGGPITRLYHAAGTGDVAKAQAALANRADVNALVERRGVTYTPLIRAARAGHCEMMRFLLSAGANPNLAGRENIGTNITPLMLAARHGHKEAVELLLQAGATVDNRIGSIFGHRGGQNAAEQAKDEGHSEIAKLLRDAAKRAT